MLEGVAALVAEADPGMRAVVQRVSSAEVRVDGRVLGRIGTGLVVLVGVSSGDTPEVARYLAEKVVNLRVFPNSSKPEHKNMDSSAIETRSAILCISQFTLYGDCRKGRRPSFDRAAPPTLARPLYEAFIAALRDLTSGSGCQVATGEFQAMMEVELVNDGPVTLLLDSEKLI